MGVKTRGEYLDALRGLRPNVYKFGTLIEDVTLHPATRRVVESHARCYDAAHDPALEAIYTTTSHLNGEKILRWNSLMRTPDDLIANMRLKRENFRRNGTCTGAVCVGWNAQNAMWAVTYDVAQELGIDYHERLKAWLLRAQREGLTVAGALTDAKGNRSLKPSQQPNPDVHVHVIESTKEGIVLRGAKVMIAGVAAAQEVFLLPGGVYGEDDRDYAVACVVPRDTEGLTIVEATHPSDRRELEPSADEEVPASGITQAYLLFKDVFVPWERVFMCGEYQYTDRVIRFFTANYRACIGACVAGQGDLMIGASMLIARANGLSPRKFSGTLVEMAIRNQITYGLGVGACSLGFAHPSGVWFADPHTANVNKAMVATLPYEVKRMAQEIAGGIGETGCMPSYVDLTHPEYGPQLLKYLKAGSCSGKARFKVARLIEWLTVGGGIPGCLHGGGSPAGAQMVVRATTPLEEYAEYARRLMGIEEQISEV